ncbi:MAG: PCYCGC motif-containing (lipo)protein [Acidobacteriota bacterium]
MPVDPSDRTPRRSSRLLVGLLAIAALAAVIAARARTQQHQHPPAKAPAAAQAGASPAAGPSRNACSACVERAAIIDASRFATWNDTDVRKAYEVARKYPDTLDQIHCFCECKESPREHHKTLLTCFTTEHGAGCGICQHEAMLAGKLKDEGASDEEVEATVEALHKTDKHPPTKGRGI